MSERKSKGAVIRATKDGKRANAIAPLQSEPLSWLSDAYNRRPNQQAQVIIRSQDETHAVVDLDSFARNIDYLAHSSDPRERLDAMRKTLLHLYNQVGELRPMALPYAIARVVGDIDHLLSDMRHHRKNELVRFASRPGRGQVSDSVIMSGARIMVGVAVEAVMQLKLQHPEEFPAIEPGIDGACAHALIELNERLHLFDLSLEAISRTSWGETTVRALNNYGMRDKKNGKRKTNHAAQPFTMRLKHWHGEALKRKGLTAQVIADLRTPTDIENAKERTVGVFEICVQRILAANPQRKS